MPRAGPDLIECCHPSCPRHKGGHSLSPSSQPKGQSHLPSAVPNGMWMGEGHSTARSFVSVSRTSILRYWMLWKDGQRVTRVFCCPQIYHASASYRDQSSQGTASSQLSAVPSITPWAKSTPSKLPCTLVTAHSQFYKTRHHPLIWGHFSCPRHCSLPHCTSCIEKNRGHRVRDIFHPLPYLVCDH